MVWYDVAFKLAEKSLDIYIKSCKDWSTKEERKVTYSIESTVCLGIDCVTYVVWVYNMLEKGEEVDKSVF